MAHFSTPGSSQIPQTFHRVTVTWKHLTHPNIVPLLGATINPPQLISDRMPGGYLTKYIASHPDMDRTCLASDVSALLYETLTPLQLSDVAEGLRHLHSRNMIHGDLKGVRDYSWPRLIARLTPRQSNVLVDASGNARITDFSLAMVTQDLDSLRRGSDECRDSARWMAPELLDSRGTYSKESDVFSFAMVAIEVRSIQPAQRRPKSRSPGHRFSLVASHLTTNLFAQRYQLSFTVTARRGPPI